jgi:potassium-transporting ATPase potassium-binding subunit
VTSAAWVQFGVVAAAYVALAPPLGAYMARVYDGGGAPGDRLLLPIERAVFRLLGVDPAREQRWSGYARSVVALGAVSWVALYALQRWQHALPLDPADVGAVSPALALNTAMSFVSNTNWQNYSGEVQLSYLTQMVGLTVQNFVSAATGMAVLAAVTRGLARRRTETLGNFWVDLTRTLTRVLLPLSLVVAVVLVVQGVVQNLDGATSAATLDGVTQAIPGGPVASQVAIKQLGSNGGGFFGANAATPFENPTPASNLVQTVAIGALAFALPLTFGRMTRRRRQGWALFVAMFVLWAASAVVTMQLETTGNAAFDAAGVDQVATATNVGGNLEGKELRFGAAASGLWAASTTATSNGSVNAMHTSFTPLAGGVALLNILLGEVSPGGVGVGMVGLLVVALLAVFLAGLMVGRTPEFLGKKLGPSEIKLVTLALLAVPVTVLVLAAVAVLVPSAVDASINTPGPHGLTELLYGFASPANNNGSAFTGLSADTLFFDLLQSVAFVVGRWLLIVPALAIAGSLGRRTAAPPGPGTFPTDGPLFTVLLVTVVLLVSGLVYFPVLALGPVAEQLATLGGGT